MRNHSQDPLGHGNSPLRPMASGLRTALLVIIFFPIFTLAVVIRPFIVGALGFAAFDLLF